MKIPEKQTVLSSLCKHARIPRVARLIDTMIAMILCGLGIYHFTQPDEAWRSGTTELIVAMLLLIAGYRISRGKAIIINLSVAVVILIAGIRHLIHGGGWKSGLVEVLFAVILVAVARIIHRDKAK